MNWLEKNLKISIGRYDAKQWVVNFATTIPVSWYPRNKVKGKDLSHIGNLWQIWTQVARITTTFGLHRTLTPSTSITNSSVWWCPLPSNWYKINLDKSIIIQDVVVACGGVLKDHDGRFISAYSANLGSCSIMHAKLWGIIFGMQVATRLGLANIMMESDSLSIVHFVFHG